LAEKKQKVVITESCMISGKIHKPGDVMVTEDEYQGLLDSSEKVLHSDYLPDTDAASGENEIQLLHDVINKLVENKGVLEKEVAELKNEIAELKKKPASKNKKKA